MLTYIVGQAEGDRAAAEPGEKELSCLSKAFPTNKLSYGLFHTGRQEMGGGRGLHDQNSSYGVSDKYNGP